MPDDLLLRRYRLQAAARELLPTEAVAGCLRALIPTRRETDGTLKRAQVKVFQASNSAFYGGLMRCSSVWMCPVCASKITERRRADLQTALEKTDLTPYLVTFTVSHRSFHALPHVLQAVTKAYRQFWSGKASQKLRQYYGITGSIRSLEVTYGENGWHPHIHTLIFLEQPLDIDATVDFIDACKTRWMQLVDSTFGPSYARGVDVRTANEDVAAYLAKYGREPKQRWSAAHEMTKQPVKMAAIDHFTPLQMLALYADGYTEYGDLWRQYALAFKGKRQLVPSRGLYERLGIRDLDDEEIQAEERDNAQLLAQLSLPHWQQVTRRDARVQVLKAAKQGYEELAYCLAGMGIFLEESLAN